MNFTTKTTELFNSAEALFDSLFGEMPATLTEVSLKKDDTIQSKMLYRKVDTDKIIYKVNVAGMKKDNINVAIDNNDIIIDIREKVEGQPDKTYYLRTIKVGSEYDMSTVKSKYTDGILEITIQSKVRGGYKSVVVE